jgi:hypothetical protein
MRPAELKKIRKICPKILRDNELALSADSQFIYLSLTMALFSPEPDYGPVLT